MLLLRYLTHPDVEVDADVPVPDWGLNAQGRARTKALAASGWLEGTVRVIASAERKAVETAGILAEDLGQLVETHPEMGENDRSATGYLPEAAFLQRRNRFFAEPDVSTDGWETATAAQARIVRAAEAALHIPAEGHVLMVGHGAVGTLLYCHFAGLAISVDHDQQGCGNYFSMSLEDRRILHPWRPMEQGP